LRERDAVVCCLILSGLIAGPGRAFAESKDEADAIRARAKTEAAAFRFQEAIACYRKAAEIYGRCGEEESALATLSSLGDVCLRAGMAAEALRVFDDVRARTKALHPGDHPNVATSLGNSATALRALGRPAEALPLVEGALAIRRRLYEADHDDLASSLDGLATTLVELGRPEEALPLHRDALAMRRRLVPGDHGSVAASMNNLAETLGELGREEEALALRRDCLEMTRRLDPGETPDLARCLNNLGMTLLRLDRMEDALSMLGEALAMERRIRGGDHPAVAGSLNNMAVALDSAGRSAEAVPYAEEAIAMNRRLYPGDHPRVATGLNNLAGILMELGNLEQALSRHTEALEMRRRMRGDDHPDVAMSLSNLARTLDELGRPRESLAMEERALAIYRRVFGAEHPHVARVLANMAHTLCELGRIPEARAASEAALAMRRRLFPGDHSDVAHSLDNLAHVLGEAGRVADELPLYEEAVAMRRRLYPGGHPDLALSLANLARCLDDLGRPVEAGPHELEAFEMRQRIFGKEHPAVVQSLNSLGHLLGEMGNTEAALQVHQTALELRRRLLPKDHPEIAISLNNVASCLFESGRAADALPLLEEALAMRRRVLGDEHAETAFALNNFAYALAAAKRRDEALAAWRESAETGRRTGWVHRYLPLVALGREALDAADPAAALAPLREAVDHLESLRACARSLGFESAARYATAIGGESDALPVLVEAFVHLGRPREALAQAERGRARGLLDLLGRAGIDPVATALQRSRDDAPAQARIEAAQRAVQEAEASDVARAKEVELAVAGGVRETIRLKREARSEASAALDRALRARLAAVQQVLPETTPLDADRLQALLSPGEILLLYSLGERASFVFVVRPQGAEVEAVALPGGLVAIYEAAEQCAKALATAGGFDRDTSRRLFELLLPPPVWAAAKSAKRLYLLPHGPLHMIPFETLATGARSLWIDEGPPIAYAPSGSVLAWLRARERGRADGAALVALGDPAFHEDSGDWPDKGVLIREVAPDGQAAALGLLAGDVIVAYGGRDVADLAGLREAMAGVPEGAESVTARFVRGGEERAVDAKPGRLGVTLAEQAPNVAGPALAAGEVRGAAGLFGPLAPLPGTRREVDAIRGAFGEGAIVTLLGEEATEPRLHTAAKGARFLHLATHGLIDEGGRASLSALALTPPRVPEPGDDGFLTLGDLLERWRGRLDGTELVVLSACESHRGKIERDEGVLALPWGFCFAGARAVVASLWKVSDDSTSLLMGDLYKRLLSEGARGPCEALDEARRALRKTHPDPHHWGAFVFVGAP